VCDDVRIVNLLNGTNFPDYSYTPVNRDRHDYGYPFPSFEGFPNHWNTYIFQAFADKDEIGVYLRVGDWPREDCALERQPIQNQLDILTTDQQTYYAYTVHPGYLEPDKKGRSVFIHWKCNTLVGYQSFNHHTEIIDTLPEEQ
jgi:hypothetical protein